MQHLRQTVATLRGEVPKEAQSTPLPVFRITNGDVRRTGGIGSGGELGAPGESGQGTLGEQRLLRNGHSHGHSLADELSTLLVLQSQAQGLFDWSDTRAIRHPAAADGNWMKIVNSPTIARVPSADSQASPPSSPRHSSPIKHASPRESTSRSPTHPKLALRATSEPREGTIQRREPAGPPGQGTSMGGSSDLPDFSSPTSPRGRDGAAAHGGRQPATPQPRRPLQTLPYADDGAQGRWAGDSEGEESGIQTWTREMERSALRSLGLEETEMVSCVFSHVLSAATSGALHQEVGGGAKCASTDGDDGFGNWEASRHLDSARSRIGQRLDAAPPLFSASSHGAANTSALDPFSPERVFHRFCLLETPCFVTLVLCCVFQILRTSNSESCGGTRPMRQGRVPCVGDASPAVPRRPGPR